MCVYSSSLLPLRPVTPVPIAALLSIARQSATCVLLISVGSAPKLARRVFVQSMDVIDTCCVIDSLRLITVAPRDK